MAERQIAKKLSDIREDHLERYEYATSICSGDVLDAACGVGYGAYIMSNSSRIKQIDGIDISQEAIQLAQSNWSTNKTNFIHQSIVDFKFEKQYDWLVTFETIEHVLGIETFLNNASKHCKNILCSVPNQKVIPFSSEKFPYHLKHYTSNEIKRLLEECGFEINTIKYQENKKRNGLNFKTGRTIIIEGSSKNIK